MSSNDKAFGVKDLQSNKSHLVPGKTGDGQNADPLQTAMHPRDEIDALIAIGKKARGEQFVEHKACQIVSQPVVFSLGSPDPDDWPDARGEKLTAIGVVAKDEYSKPSNLPSAYNQPIIISEQDLINEAKTLELEYNEDFEGRLADLEKEVEDLKERLVKAFKHQGFNF